MARTLTSIAKIFLGWVWGHPNKLLISFLIQVWGCLVVFHFGGFWILRMFLMIPFWFLFFWIWLGVRFGSAGSLCLSFLTERLFLKREIWGLFIRSQDPHTQYIRYYYYDDNHHYSLRHRPTDLPTYLPATITTTTTTATISYYPILFY